MRGFYKKGAKRRHCLILYPFYGKVQEGRYPGPPPARTGPFVRRARHRMRARLPAACAGPRLRGRQKACIVHGRAPRRHACARGTNTKKPGGCLPPALCFCAAHVKGMPAPAGRAAFTGCFLWHPQCGRRPFPCACAHWCRNSARLSSR